MLGRWPVRNARARNTVCVVIVNGVVYGNELIVGKVPSVVKYTCASGSLDEIETLAGRFVAVEGDNIGIGACDGRVGKPLPEAGATTMFAAIASLPLIPSTLHLARV